jgi:hypothetical protein
VKIWSWAGPREKIKMIFKAKAYLAKTDKNGNCKIILPSQKAEEPYEMTFQASNKIKIEDVLFGFVRDNRI